MGSQPGGRSKFAADALYPGGRNGIRSESKTIFKRKKKFIIKNESYHLHHLQPMERIRLHDGHLNGF